MNVEDRCMNVGEGRRKMSSVRPVWEDVLRTRWRETQRGGSVSGIFPPKLMTEPQIVPRVRCGRGMHRIE